MLKVLVIAYYFPPMGLSGVQRTLKFVKYLKNYNWEPIVLTTSEVGYYAHDQSLKNELDQTNARVIRIGSKEPNSLLAGFGTMKLPREFIRKSINRLSQIFFIPDNKIAWAKAAYKKCLNLLETEQFDAIFISGPPFSLFDVFSNIKKKYHIPLMLDYRDLWVDNQFSFYLTPFHRILHKKKEYKALKAADKVIVTNRRIKEKLIKDYTFLSFDDVFIIPHGYDPQDLEKVKRIKKSDNKMLITYAGIFYEFITPKYFLKAFKEILVENPEVGENIRLAFVGLLRKENQKLIRKLKIEPYVTEYGYLDHIQTIQKLLMSDILWMMVGNGKSASTVSSGKLYEYFGTRKPVLACLPDGALKLAANEYKASFVVEPESIDQIKNSVKEIYNLYRKGELPEPNEDFVENFRRDFLTEQLAKQLNNILKISVA
jgi:glycosyltransferase involved in cell wall biosynthesis